ncbi:MAG: outer membrane beta-barrel protein [Candidatus Omnitrophica bacterium]|nr:outer membrane beta-barrel protein [Candidatus Omnitrophota bacterium]
MRDLPRMRLFFMVMAGMTLYSASAWAYKVGDFEIKPLGSISEGYDDNMTSVKSGKISDLFTDITGGVNVSAEGKEQSLSLSGALSRKFFNSKHRYDYTSENIDLDYKHDLSQFGRIHAVDSFIHSEDPGSLADAFGRATGRFQYFLNRFDLDYTHEFSSQSSLTVGYANEAYNPSGSDQASSMLNSISLKKDYSLSSADIVSGVYSFSQRTFDPGGHIDSNTFDLGLRHFLTKQLYLDLLPGIGYVSDGKSFLSARYEASITNNVSEKTSAKLSFVDRSESNYSTDDIFSYWRVSFDIMHEIRERLGVVIGLFYGDGRYHAADTRDKFNGVNARLNYEISKDVTGFISLTRTQTVSNIETNDYIRDVTMLGFQIKF